MSISAHVRTLLELRGRRALPPEVLDWFVDHVRTASWQSLKHDFPTHWELVARSKEQDAGLARRLAKVPGYNGWLREDVVLVAARDGRPLPKDVLSKRPADAVRAGAAAAVMRRDGPRAARSAFDVLRVLKMHQLQQRLGDGADQISSASTLTAAGGAAAGGAGIVASGLDYEALTRTPGFEDFAGGLLAEMAGSGSGEGQLPAAVPEIVPDVLGEASDFLDTVVDWLDHAAKVAFGWFTGGV